MSTRLEREREFHDHVFTEMGVRAAAQPFRSVLGAFHKWNLETLSAYAPGARVLEYGCGQGSRAYHLARCGAQVVGIDISPVAIEQAIEQARTEGLEDRMTFRVMNAEQLEFADDSFDLVCGSGVLHHLDLNRAYAEVARVLTPTGVGVFEEPLGHNPAINAYRRRTPAMRTVDEHPLLMSDLALAESYFGEVETRFFTLTSLAAFPLRNLPGFKYVVRGLDALDRSLFRVVPPVRRYAWQAGITLRHPRPSEAGAGQ